MGHLLKENARGCGVEHTPGMRSISWESGQETHTERSQIKNNDREFAIFRVAKLENGTLFLAEGVWMGKSKREQQKAWKKQILEVQTWRQVSGPAGAVMCETRVLGMNLPQWHTLLFEGQVAVDMRVVCPQDEKQNASETSQDGPLEKLGSEARVWRVEGRSAAGANPSYAAKEDQRSVDGQAPKYDEESGRERRTGGENMIPHWMVGREEEEVLRLDLCASWREVRNQLPEGMEQVGATGHDVERRPDGAKRNYVAPTERRHLEETLFVGPQVGFGKTRRLEHVS